MKTYRPLVSIIVPAHNTQRFIGKCLDSLVGQTCPDIEIIVINDGSTDKTEEIIEYYKKNDTRIKLVEQSCAGPNVARRNGVLRATGEYIMFVDSDDFISADSVERLKEYFLKYDVDTIRFDGQHCPVKKNLSSSDFCKKNHLKVLDKEEINKVLLTTYNLNSLCLQIYKASMLKEMSTYSEMIYAEDFVANLDILSKAERMLVISDVLYYYNSNPESTTRHLSKSVIYKRISDRSIASIKAINYAFDILSEQNDINDVVYYQTKMVRDGLLGISNIKSYSKQQFMMDVKKTEIKGYKKVDIDIKKLDGYMRKMNFFDRLKNKKIVLAILEQNYDYVWKYIKKYKVYTLLSKKMQHKKCSGQINKYMRGRLGNQLFQYATLRYIQELNHNQEEICLNFDKYVYSLGFNNDLNGFRLQPYTEVNDIKLLPSQKIRILADKIRKRLHRAFAPSNYKEYRYKLENKKARELQQKGIYWKEDGALEMLPTNRKNIIAIGHFESAKNFDSIRTKLLEEIQPIEPPLKKNTSLYDSIESSESVCISVRRGDFVENPVFAKNYNVCGEEYFDLAVEEIKKRIKNPVFIIFSDDIDWCKHNIKLPNEIVLYEDGDDPVWEKLRLMYSCKHFIISNSTFSWWAQYLSRNENKIVVAPRKWTNLGYDKDIYEKGWILVDNVKENRGKKC